MKKITMILILGGAIAIAALLLGCCKQYPVECKAAKCLVDTIDQKDTPTIKRP